MPRTYLIVIPLLGLVMFLSGCGDPSIAKTIQERAWTSPNGYSP